MVVDIVYIKEVYGQVFWYSLSILVYQTQSHEPMNQLSHQVGRGSGWQGKVELSITQTQTLLELSGTGPLLARSARTQAGHGICVKCASWH